MESEYENYAILVVDDEPINLNTIVKNLRKQSLNVEGVKSGPEALSKLKEKKYHVIVSDEKMYPMTGVQLLKQVAQIYPDIMRIIITGYTDYDAAMRAINDAQVYRFIQKESKVADELFLIVKQAIDFYREREEKIRLQKILIRENKLAALGQISVALSHELNNPLNTINVFTQILTEKYGEPSFKEYFLENIPDAVKKMRTIISRMAALTGEESEKDRKILNVHNLVEETLELFSKDRTKKVKIIKDLKDTKSVIEVDKVQIIQVLHNLLSNGTQAIKEGQGQIEIITEKDPITLKNREGKDAQYIRLIVKDNGHGIEQKILEKIFDPFMTTHNVEHDEKERRPGLGLFISQMIIEGHHGYIDIQSKVGEGTTVVIDLPVA